MPARQSVRRKPRRPARPVRQQQRSAFPPPESVGTVEGQQPTAQTEAAVPRTNRQPPMSATRMALTARAAELARLDVIYLRHDLRNVGVIAGFMLAIIIGLSFVLH